MERLPPWVADEEGARKCLAFLRAEENLELNVEKADGVLASLREEHERQYPRVPWELPKTWPGMLHVLRRSSDKLGD